MNGLRLALLFVGLAIIAGIYFWGTSVSLGRRRNRWLAIVKRRRGEEPIEAPALMPPIGNGDIDYSETLADLSGLLHQARAAATAGVADQARAGEDTGRTISSRPSKTMKRKTPPEAAVSEAQIIALYLTAPSGHGYTGSAIRNAAEAIGMRFGDKGVFHHFGIGEMQSKDSLFCLASMFEPGSFDLDQLASFETAGLALFMRLPLPVDAGLAFELMLNTAQRLAQRLGGDLRDDRRDLLGGDQVERLRRKAVHAHP